MSNEAVKKCELVLSGLRMIDASMPHLPEFIDAAYTYAEECGFNKEIINDAFMLQLMMNPDSSNFVCAEFLATTLLVDAARYATRLDDPGKFSWEHFFMWYGSMGLNG